MNGGRGKRTMFDRPSVSSKPFRSGSPRRVRAEAGGNQARGRARRGTGGKSASGGRSIESGGAARRSELPEKRAKAGVRPGSSRSTRRPRRSVTPEMDRRETPEESALEQEQRESAYGAGYELGLYEGGEQLLEQAVPPHLLLPGATLREVIAAGVERLLPQSYPLLTVGDVYERMESAIVSEKPCAVVRLGDGELLALAQESVYDAATVEREGRFLPYAGVRPPDLFARDQLALAVSQAQIVGVPLSRRKHFQPLLHPVLRAHGIDPAKLSMTDSTINYGLYRAGYLNSLLKGRRLLLIGNAAPDLARVLTERGYTVTKIISPVAGFGDIERVMGEVRDAVFDLALVSAGIPAVVLCWRIAAERGKTALDFGHMANMIVKGEAAL